LNRLLKKFGGSQAVEGEEEGEDKQVKDDTYTKKKFDPLNDIKGLDMNLVNLLRINEIMFMDLVDSYQELLE